MQCMWCKGDFDLGEGPVHEYMESTPGCWATYSKVLAVEYQNYKALHDVHRLTVDTYAAQHPGRPSRKSIQSTWGHLVALYFYLEKGFDGEQTRRQIERFVEFGPELVWLRPPDFTGAVNVSHVAGAVDDQDHLTRVKEWGQSVYASWCKSHASEIQCMAQKTLW